MNNKKDNNLTFSDGTTLSVGEYMGWSKQESEEFDELLDKHYEFKKLFIADRIYDKKDNPESIWVRKSVNDLGWDKDNVTECLIDNLLEKKFYIATFFNGDRVLDKTDENYGKPYIFHEVYF